MPSEICLFCGIEIKFRHISGAVVPLHPSGSTCIGRTLYRNEERDICHRTRCPKCRSGVYFIRHNGGCAWFNHLGQPWSKHGCFAEVSRSPAGWEERLKQGWRICYLWYCGPFVDETGGVFVICDERPNRRLSERHLPQVKLQQEVFNHDALCKLDGKSVLLSEDGSKIFTADAAFWSVSEHIPSYRRRWFQSGSEPSPAII